jgi:hypothetical protein
MNTRNVWIILLFIALALSLGAAMEQGPEQIDINTGGKGLVPFPHRDHQTRLVDCMICHELFPQEKNSILKLKDEGKLKKKQVMKDLCIKCHKDTLNAGKESGPVKCSQCHTKR